ncbi:MULTISPECIES: TMEM175 family protein [unclassified Arthrobacter]|uniref:TMEM175 family protein n=1 Tax=unclassified Arthrobacter TaxID=235627 RepID=UPI002E03BA65|nr:MULTISPECIES: TMEM175 family protein [unclassified Arthrobacter]MEC5193129.1 putative membrane protein [Arthrobacter sp. MP_M4]MEC5204593.1 putative membrane protein [Arthrobacter sp. MP_M7]
MTEKADDTGAATKGEEVDTGRLEAFSDGVFAIAITLLVIDINVPETPGTLAHRLAAEWPSYLGFAISFAMIGIMWLNHHQMLREIRAADHGLVVTNLALLATVTVIPFPTKVLGDQLARGTYDDQRTAAVLYALGFLAFALAINAMWLWAAHHRRLIKPDTPDYRVTGRTRRNALGVPAFATAALLALVSPQASLALDGLLAVFYLIPGSLVGRLLRRPSSAGRT